MPAEMTFDCFYCAPPEQIGPHITHDAATATETAWRQYWKDIGPTHATEIACSVCDALHGLVDDAVAASAGGGLDVVNTSTPKITSLDVVTGPAAGGTTVVITGDFLEVGTLTVKFDGVAATNMTSRTKTSVTVDSPAGSVGLVDVTVENDHGQRKNGGSALTSGFEFTA